MHFLKTNTSNFELFFRARTLRNNIYEMFQKYNVFLKKQSFLKKSNIFCIVQNFLKFANIVLFARTFFRKDEHYFESANIFHKDEHCFVEHLAVLLERHPESHGLPERPQGLAKD